MREQQPGSSLPVFIRVRWAAMVDDLRTIAASFDQRAARYATVEWHRAYAQRFVELASLEPGQRVLDAGAGTGFATIEIARRVGAAGHVVAVDVSAGMLAQLRIGIDAENLSHVELLQGDATNLPELPGSTFDAVLCSSALLYMSAAAALREWHRLLKPSRHRRLLDDVRRFAAAGTDVSRVRQNFRPGARGPKRRRRIRRAVPRGIALGRVRRRDGDSWRDPAVSLGSVGGVGIELQVGRARAGAWTESGEAGLAARTL